MSLETFLHHLHFDIAKTQPRDWKVDWEDTPLPYKRYHGLPAIPLSLEVPLTLKGCEVPVKPKIREIGHFFWYGFGLSQFCQPVHPSGAVEHAMYRRFVPSGGALYPNELYVYLNMDEVSRGIYHYDAAHHRLVLLRKGDYDSYLARALGYRCDVSAYFGVVFVSTMFQKNGFKYHHFAYRLQGLDTGVLIGQLLEVAKRFGFESAVYFRFLDRAVNHLLGLSEWKESVYAVVPLALDPRVTRFDEENNDKSISAEELCRELTVLQHEHDIRSKRRIEYPMIIRMNEASLLESIKPFRQVKGEKNSSCEGEIILLPRVDRLSYDLAAVCRKRFSPGIHFVLDQVSQSQLAALLREATASFSYRNDLDGAQENLVSRVSLVGCLHGVEGIPDGAYHYDRAAHAFRQIRPGDHRRRLQQGMSSHTVNLSQVPLCFHVTGDRDHLKGALGYRGYRIQQMEAGMLTHRLLLAASALGMGGHPLLDFDAGSCDELYRLAPQGKTSLIQIPIGPYRLPPRLQGSLHG
ncbi:SagB family peptide dehydrogenase [Desmospora profundinema]|uniref:SagB-type dehydrogenase family enzyme n=1 Tax=Desmospora profundinema TaxID=1571184 RepID=A0ABU1IGW8_9BACL|nr:SagB family peptide dehydrogenase [Desmospora profundinema]MDR6224025.1 SagB-type dehydrogenase family enzyme [Desmospora profundinema]